MYEFLENSCKKKICDMWINVYLKVGLFFFGKLFNRN